MIGIDGATLLLVYTDDIEYKIAIEDLHDLIYEGKNHILTRAYNTKKLLIRSVKKNGTIELKPIIDIFKNYTPHSAIHNITTDTNDSLNATVDCNLGWYVNTIINRIKISDHPQKIAMVYNDAIILSEVISNELTESQDYMFNLTVQDNKNYVLHCNMLVIND